MVAFDEKCESSPAKSRRRRAAATKQKLYAAASDKQQLVTMQSQLAIVASTLDNFRQHFMLLHHAWLNKPSSFLNAEAQEFTPSQHISNPHRLSDTIHNQVHAETQETHNRNNSLLLTSDACFQFKMKRYSFRRSDEPASDAGRIAAIEVGCEWIGAEPKRPPSANFLSVAQQQASWERLGTQDRAVYESSSAQLRAEYELQMAEFKEFGKYRKPVPANIMQTVGDDHAHSKLQLSKSQIS